MDIKETAWGGFHIFGIRMMDSGDFSFYLTDDGDLCISYYLDSGDSISATITKDEMCEIVEFSKNLKV